MYYVGFVLSIVLLIPVVYIIAQKAKIIFQRATKEFSIIKNAPIRENLSIAASDLKRYLSKNFSIKRYVLNHPYILFNLFTVSLLLTFQNSIHSYYRFFALTYILWVGTFALLHIPKILLSKKSKYEITTGMIFVSLTLLQIGFSSISEIFNGAIHGNLPFRLVTIGIVVFVVPFISTMKLLIDTTRKTISISIMSMITFIISELYLFLLFGVYNLTHEPQYRNHDFVQVMNNFYPFEQFVRIEYFGAINVFTLKSIDITREFSMIPAVEFLFGMVFNILIVGFFISYVSSVVIELRAKKKTTKKRLITSNCPKCKNKVDLVLIEDDEQLET